MVRLGDESQKILGPMLAFFPVEDLGTLREVIFSGGYFLNEI